VAGSSNLRPDLKIPEELLNEDPILVQKLNWAGGLCSGGIAPSIHGVNPRATTPGDAKDIVQFFELVQQVVNDKMDREQIDPEQRVLFVEEFPPQDMRTEVITFGLVSRQPGQTSAGPIDLDANRREMRPTFRQMVESDDPGYKNIIAGQWFDNIVSFTCWAKTNKVANCRALWFEDLMIQYNWFFQYSGLPRGAIFLNRLEDTKDEQSSNKLVKRELRYHVRTERLYTISQKTLTELVIKLHSGEVGSLKQK